MEKIKIRGLFQSAGWIFFIWGSIVAVKGAYDVFWGEPEANYFSAAKWEFVSRQQWYTWSGFEISYGLACIGVAYLLRTVARRVPVVIARSSAA
jgi:hypothetical protein